MDGTVILYLLVLLLALFLFVREVFPMEISALLITIVLIAFDLLDQRQAFQNFGNEAIILIAALLVLVVGLRKTGLLQKLEEIIGTHSANNPTRSFLLLLVLVGCTSSFISNTATLAVVIPVAGALAHKNHQDVRLWLLPLAFMAVLGGVNSLIGTSSNIIVSGLLPEYGLAGLSLFSTTSVGLPISLAGLAYLLVARKYFLSKPDSRTETKVDLKYDVRSYTAEAVLSEESPFCNKSLQEISFFSDSDTTVLGVLRAGQPIMYPGARFILLSGDRLILEGNIARLTELTERFGLKFTEHSKQAQDTKEIKPFAIDLHEVLVTANSALNNRTIAEVFLRNRYQISLIAINRQGVTLHDRLSRVRLLAGDILVVQFIGPVDNTILDYLGLVPLQKLQHQRYDLKMAPLALLLFAGALVLGSFSGISLALSCLGAALLMIVFKIISIEEVYGALEWRVLIFLGAVMSLGTAMKSSGTADYLALHLSQHLAGVDPNTAIALFLVLTVVLTTLLSNQATAVIMTPLAISTAEIMGFSPMPFVMAIIIAASCSFLAPFEPVFMMVLGPGRYRFRDVFWFGLPLTILCMALAYFIIPLAWPV